MFTRRSKKLPVIEPSQSPHDQIASHARMESDRRKQHPNEASVSNGEFVPRRRSARLSGEKAGGAHHESNTQRGRSLTKDVTLSPAPSQRPENGIRVEKKRRTTKIALPFADTPVIARNKEMRKASSESRRRSSSTLRGRRASSLIDSGTSNGELLIVSKQLRHRLIQTVTAVPHSEVKTSEFYKHIGQELPEPRRMKQLLTWCGARALSDRPTGTTGDTNAVLAGKF